jgi:hypothetical protein
MGGSLFKVGIYCLRGPLEIGQTLVTAYGPGGECEAVHVEVLEIEFFDHLLAALDPEFSGNVIVTGNLGPAGQDWTLGTGDS